jgi:hypothetical protein
MRPARTPPEASGPARLTRVCPIVVGSEACIGLPLPDGGAGHLVVAASSPEVVCEGLVRGRVDARDLDHGAGLAAATTGDADLSALHV